MARRSLDAYRDKRDPVRTPEPFGGELRPGTGALFVVQQHAARSLHWDLRLEIDGILVSWAIPKGPSADPEQKRLAVQTEDHPIEYGDFEGVIPAGNYGAGPMILWDRGVYRIVDGTTPAEGLAAGKIDLELFGHKLRGRWALVHLAKGETRRQWLFIKKADHFASDGDLIADWPQSVVSGLRVDERADPSERVGALVSKARGTGAPRALLRKTDLAPMLAVAGDHAFSDAEWIYEVKYDGVRAALARLADGTFHFSSRNGLDFSERFPEIALVGRYLPHHTFAIDGEVIAVEESGAGSFELLQSGLGGRLGSSVRVVMYAFDLLHLDGFDLRSLDILARKELLRALLPTTGPVRYADHLHQHGEELFEIARQRGLEGIVAKRLRTPYRSGKRSRDWLKLKLPRITRLAVVGWQPTRGSQTLGSLLLGWIVDGRLRFAGKVGSGIDRDTAAGLLARLETIRVEAPKLEIDATDIPRRAVFVEPEHVALVRYTEATSRGLLRHPVFVDLDEAADWRDCVSPAEVGAEPGHERPTAPPDRSSASTWSPTNLDKVYWPAEGYRKRDLLEYYQAVWPYISPYLRDRPLVLTRYPDGIDGKSFFQKHAPEHLPSWVGTVTVGGVRAVVCNDLESLLYVANLGCIPIHIAGARADRADRPDWLVLDLDPKQAPFEHVVRVARHLVKLLTDVSLPSFIKTSGQTGLHVMVPLPATARHDDAKMLAEVIAKVTESEIPEIATVARPLAERRGRVYIDYLQNGRGKTIAAPYCVRPAPGAPISMPLRWRQVTSRLTPKRFTIKTSVAMVRKLGDPMRWLLDGSLEVDEMLAAIARLRERLGGLSQ